MPNYGGDGSGDYGSGDYSGGDGTEETSPTIGDFREAEREIEIADGAVGYSVDDGSFSTTVTAWDTVTGVAEVNTSTSMLGGIVSMETTETFDMTMDDTNSGYGQNISSDTTVSSLGLDFTYDTHFDDRNVEASFFTEQIADIVDAVNQKQNTLSPETIGTMSLIEDVAKIAVAGVPTTSFAMLGSSKLGFQALGALSLYGKATTFASIAERLGGSSSSDNRAVDGIFDGGTNAISKAIDRITNSNIRNTQKQPPLTAPLLAPTVRFASLASIVGEASRQDVAYQTINMFRINYGTDVEHNRTFTVGAINEYKI